MAQKYNHGGDVYSLENNVKDFSANINPFGIPKNVVAVLKKEIENWNTYPDPFSRELRRALGQYHRVHMDSIICGNGAADLIFRLAMVMKNRGDSFDIKKKALVTAPTFSEYKVALESYGFEVLAHKLKVEEEFSLEREYLDALDANIKIAFICNPNNPTGVPVKKEILLEILRRAKERDIYVVVDECFISFLDDGENYSLVDMIEEYENLFILKAFTKNYAMAGFRLGYLISSNRQVLDEIFSVAQPWTVSWPAQSAGLAALKEEEYLIKSRKVIREQRKALKEYLESRGFTNISGEANYILFKTPKALGGGYNFREVMLQRGFLIRNCDNYSGLDGDYSRIAVKLPMENVEFMAGVEEYISTLETD